MNTSNRNTSTKPSSPAKKMIPKSHLQVAPAWKAARKKLHVKKARAHHKKACVEPREGPRKPVAIDPYEAWLQRSPEAEAQLQRAIFSAQHEPLVNCGSFVAYLGDDTE